MISFFQVFAKRSGSTFIQLRHLKNSHQNVYNDSIKDKLENPEMPDAVDSAHPIWRFFENPNGDDESKSGHDDVSKSARCHDCLVEFPFSENVSKNLEDHLRAEHSQHQQSYETFCTGTQPLMVILNFKHDFLSSTKINVINVGKFT